MMIAMWERVLGILIVATLSLAACGVAACGGGENGGDGTEQAGASNGDERRQLKSHNDSGGGAEQYRNARSAGTVVEFGSEAGPQDFAEVAAALHGYLDAKEARDWELACEYMSTEAVESISQFAPDPEAMDCPELLEEFSSGTSPEILRRLAIADVGSVRISGDQAHALYTGAQKLGFFMPMVYEDGLWKVRALAPSMLP